MKYIKWKILAVTSLVCLLPILLGMALWNELPDTMAIHFDINNNPDGFASKGFVVFGLPVLMLVLQAVCCVINDVNAFKHGERKKFELVTKWIIPVMSVILYTITVFYGLGKDIDIRIAVNFILGIIFIVLGNYMPKLDYVKNYDVDTEKARKINRFIGYETVVMGFLFLICVFLPPVWTIGCIFLLIPYTILSVIYGMNVSKK